MSSVMSAPYSSEYERAERTLRNFHKRQRQLRFELEAIDESSEHNSPSRSTTPHLRKTETFSCLSSLVGEEPSNEISGSNKHYLSCPKLHGIKTIKHTEAPSANASWGFYDATVENSMSQTKSNRLLSKVYPYVSTNHSTPKLPTTFGHANPLSSR